MEWAIKYIKDTQPTPEEISSFIDNPLWERFNTFIGENYSIEPDYSYSGCSAQPGWNIKYKKGGKSLCTLYPMDGYFIVLVVVGRKELPEVEMILPACTEYIQDIFADADDLGQMGRWLMIEVKDEDILEDVLNLIQIRRRINK